MKTEDQPEQLKIQDLANAVMDVATAGNQQSVLIMTLLQYLLNKGVVNLSEFQTLFRQHTELCFDKEGQLKVDTLAHLVTGAQVLEKES